MTEVAIKVIIDAQHLSQTQMVCDRLRALGMTVDVTYPEIGVIFGHAEEGMLPKLSHAEGVEVATNEGVYVLPPPNGEVPR